jgi:hypothetical protein
VTHRDDKYNASDKGKERNRRRAAKPYRLGYQAGYKAGQAAAIRTLQLAGIEESRIMIAGQDSGTLKES